MRNLDNISARIRGDIIPMRIDRNGVYVIDLVQYQKMKRIYEPKGPIHIHTFESVAADILKERVKGRYYTQ
jgi:hypothetical protein